MTPLIKTKKSFPILIKPSKNWKKRQGVMSKMNALEKLLDGANVAWVPLGSVATLQRGRVMSKEYLADNAGDYPVYSSQTANNGMIGKIDTFDFDGEFLSWTTDGANAGTVFYRTGKFSVTNVCGLIKINDELKLNYKFLFYWLTTEAQKHVYSGMGNPKLMSHQVEKIPIPIPCPDDPKKSLAIQAEIVRILDAFTVLTAELTAELTARKKQYNHYRDQLLTFVEGDGIKEMTIGDIYDFQYGTGNTIPTTGGQYPVYGSNGIVGSHHEYNSEDSPVIGHIGAYAGIVNWGEGKHFVTYNGVICRHKSKDVLSKYAYYLLLLQDFGSKSNSASQPFVSYHILKAPIVLVPSLSEQARVVAILDKFDALTNSLQEGLPREINLRQKQYEYYRDLLLNFPKPEEQAA
jgi:type I restriction enzyme S subunit